MIWLHSWKFFAICSAVLAALTTIFGKIGVSEVNSNFATMIRTIVILIFTTCLLSFTHFKFSSIRNISSQSFIFLVISGLCTGLSWLCYYRALQLGPASSIAPVDKMSVVIAIFLAWFCLGEKMSWNIVLGAGLILTGSLIILIK